MKSKAHLTKLIITLNITTQHNLLNLARDPNLNFTKNTVNLTCLKYFY